MAERELLDYQQHLEQEAKEQTKEFRESLLGAIDRECQEYCFVTRVARVLPTTSLRTCKEAIACI